MFGQWYGKSLPFAIFFVALLPVIQGIRVQKCLSYIDERCSFIRHVPLSSDALTNIYTTCSIAGSRLTSSKCLFKDTSPSNADIRTLYSLPESLNKVVQMFRLIPGGISARSRQLVLFGQKCPPMDPKYKSRINQVMGCQSTVFLHPELRKEGENMKLYWSGDSDGLLTKGLVHLLLKGLNGCSPKEVEEIDPDFITATRITEFLATSRINGFMNMVRKMQLQAKLLGSLHSETQLLEGT